MLAGVLGLIGLGAVALYVMTLPRTLSIAVGPPGSENHRLVTVLAQLLVREKSSTRLRIVTTDGGAASAAAVSASAVDLAVVRSDVDTPSQGLVVAVLRRDQVMILAHPDAGIENVPDLAGKTVGVVFAQGANQALLQRVLAHHGMSAADVAITVVPLDQVASAMNERRVDAIFSVGNPLTRQATDLVGRVATGVAKPPVFVPIIQAEAMAQRSTAVEAAEILRGAFSGAPPRPAETVKTLAILHRLVAQRTLDEDVIAAFTQTLFSLRPAMTLEFPAAQLIEAPDTDRGANYPVHPGATAYIEGNIKSFLDRYSEWFYLIVMMLGIGGSAVAGLASLAQGRGRGHRKAELMELSNMLALARRAEELPALEALEARLDAAFAATLERMAAQDLDTGEIAAYTLALDQLRRAIAERRLALAIAAPRPRLAAAE
jgi:TRAP transporter TAXI family solute receptor